MIDKIIYGPAVKIAAQNFHPGDVLISFANSFAEHVRIQTDIPRFFINCSSAQYVEEGAIFTEAMGKELVDFLQQNYRGKNLSVFINCDHGEIRSASCAKALKDFFDVPCFFVGSEIEADPNVFCYRIYDHVLDALV